MASAYLKEGVLLFALELIRSKQLQTTSSFLFCETILVALKQFEDVIDNEGLDIDFLFII